MENPISYSDLFSPDIQQGIEGLVSDIMRVEKQLKGMLESVKSEAQTLGEALAGVSSATKGGRDTTKADSAQVDKLYEAYTQLSKMYEENQKTLKALLDTEKTQNKRLAKSKTATDEYASALDRLKAQAALANEALAKVGTSGNSAKIKQLQAVVKGLEEQVKNLTKAQNNNANATNNASKPYGKQKAELLSLSDAYASLAPLVEKTGVDLNALITTEKQHQQVSKNGQIANTALAGSYNQLYAQYNLIKLALNAMNTEMRNSEDAGKVLEAEAARIMAIMKEMQAATGKYTLDVGNYSEGVTKALNGLNIATMQVMREMPTLANSLSQFFIAISNNVPIFVDNFKRAQVALGSFTKAVGATLKVVFSWQTVLLVILTILPKIAKAIHDKRKAQEEEAKAQEKATKETEKAEKAYRSLANIYTDISKSASSSVTEVNVLTKILDDNNTSLEERIGAGQRLKQIFDEELEGYSAEEIAMGKASGLIKNLTTLIYQQAKARATLNEITELTNKQLELEERAKLYENFKYGTRTVKELSDALDEANKRGEKLHLGAAEQEAVNTYRSIIGEITGLQNQINTLTEGIDPNFLIDDKGGSLKDKILEIPSYYNDALKAIIDGMEDGIQKQLALLDYDFKVEREKRMEQQAALEDMLAKHNAKELKLTKEQVARIKAELSNLALAMVAEEQNYLDARKRMLNAMFQPQEVEETDPEQELIDSIRMRLTVVKNYQDKVSAMNYANDRAELMAREHTLAEEVALKDKYNEELIQHEKEYWENYLEEMRAEGLELTDEYKEIMDRIAQLTGKRPSTRTSTHKKRGSANYRNLTEAAFAMNPITGYKDKNGVSRIKDEYLDFANSVNTALQTSMDYMDEWMDKRIEMAEVAVEAAQRETESAKTALDYEMQARANGYANNVELARKEYEQKLQMEREAIAERKRLEKIQEGINTAQQIGALVTATANLWSGYSEIPIVGPALAIAATALMWGSFFAAKIQAAQLANAETHGQGMAEYIDYGGSHASHNDVDFGRTKDGRRRRVERGEVVGVVRKDKVQKYGIDRVMNIINNLNNGTFEKNYVSSTELVNSVMGESPESRANSAFFSAKVEDMLRSAESRSTVLKTGNTGIFDAGQLEANYEMAFNGASTDLSGVEQGIETLIEQNRVRVVSTPWGRIEYKGNNKRIIRNS